MSQTIPAPDSIEVAATGPACCAPDGDAESWGHSYDVDKGKIQARLKRIEGQVRGISRMVDEEKYCIDILTQVSAVIASMRSVGMLVLEDHIRGCVMNADPTRRDETVEELNAAIERFVRSIGN